MSDILTIFTPTYNRAILLEDLYKSLISQSCYDFEWLIIDDESTDCTETIVKQWKTEQKKFLIRYYKQIHGGKHRALNKAFDLAFGDFFFIVDSDDQLIPNAVELVSKWCNNIKDNKIMAGVAGLKISMDGKTWGGDLDYKYGEYIDANNLERQKYNMLGDKAEVYRTELLKRYKFPEYAGEYFVTEAVCWDSIAAAGYKIRWYNTPIYMCEYLEDGLTCSGANEIKGHCCNYQGYCYYVKQCMKIKSEIDWMPEFIIFNKTGNYLGKSYKNKARDLNISIVKYGYYLTIKYVVIYFIRGINKLIRVLGLRRKI